MTVAHTESIRNVLGVHATALQSPTPQTAAVDSGRFVGSNWQQANGSCIPHPSFLGLCGWHDGVLLRLEIPTRSSTSRMVRPGRLASGLEPIYISSPMRRRYGATQP
jgi:hypothetical protein